MFSFKNINKFLRFLFIFIFVLLIVLISGDKIEASTPSNLNPTIEFFFKEKSSKKTEMTVDEFKSSFVTVGANNVVYMELYAKALSNNVDLGVLAMTVTYDSTVLSHMPVIQFPKRDDPSGFGDPVNIWTGSYESGSYLSIIPNTAQTGVGYETFVKDVPQLVLTVIVKLADGVSVSDLTEDMNFGIGIDDLLIAYSGDVVYNNTNATTPTFQVGTPEATADASLSGIDILGGSSNSVVIDDMSLFTSSGANTYRANVNLTYADSRTPLNLNTITTTNPSATVNVTGNTASSVSPFVSNSEITIAVTHMDVTNYYILVVQSVESVGTDKVLTGLSVKPSGGSNLISGFSSGVLNYTVSVANQFSSVVVDAQIPNTSKATVSIDGAVITPSISGENKVFSRNITGLVEGASRDVFIVVTAEDGSTNTYKVTINRENKSNNSQLTSLKVKVVGQGTIDGVFNGNAITVNVPEYTGSAVSFSLEMVTSSSVVQSVKYKVGGGSYQNASLSSGKYVTPNIVTNLMRGDISYIDILVTAQDGSTSEYALEVIRAKSSNTSLEKINVEQGSTTYTASRNVDAFTYGSTGVDNLRILPVSPTLESQTFVIKKGSNTGPVVTDGNVAYSSLVMGSNMFYIIVTANDGITTKEYTLNINVKSTENNLVSYRLYDASNPSFEYVNWTSTETQFTNRFAWVKSSNRVELRLASSEKSKITVTSSNPSITVTPGATENIVSVSYTFSGSTELELPLVVSVAAEDRTIVASYNILLVQEAADSESRLESLKVNGIDVPGFNSDVYMYPNVIVVDREMTQVQVLGTKHSNSTANVSITYNGSTSGVIDLNPLGGEAKLITVSVTAQSGAVSTYTIKVIAGSNNNSIFNVSFSGISSYTFFPETLTSTIESPAGNLSTVVSVTTVAPYLTKIYIDGVLYPSGQKTVTLQEGQTKIQVYAVSESGVKGETYTFNINRGKPKTNNLLEDLVVNVDGQPQILIPSSNPGTPGFNPNTLDYKLRVNYDVTNVFVTATLPSGVGSKLIFDNGRKDLLNQKTTITIIVEAEDTTKNYYNIEVTRADDNNNVSKVSVAGVEYDITEFIGGESDTYKVLNITDVFAFATKKLNVTFTLENQYATINKGILDASNNWTLVDGLNTLEFYAISQAGSIGQKYRVNLTRTAASTDTTLRELKLNMGTTNLLSSAFNSTLQNSIYEVRVDNNVNSLNVVATPNGVNAQITITPSTAVSLTNKLTTVTIRVTAEGGNIGEHIIKITKANDVNSISDIRIDGLSLVDKLGNNFDASTYEYTLSDVLFIKNKISLEVLTDASAIVFVNNIQASSLSDVNLVEGLNTIRIKVQSEFGSNGNEYTIYITRAFASDENELTGIKVNGIDVTDFDQTTSAIMYFLPGTTTVNLTVVGLPAGATVTYNGKASNVVTLDGSNLTTILVSVKSERGTENIYSLRVRAVSTANDITGITLSRISGNTSITPAYVFDKDIFVYNITVPYSIDYTLIGVTTNGATNITGAGRFDLSSEGVNTVNVYATSDAGIKGNTYTFNISRETPSTNAFLDDLVVEESGTNLLASTFNKTTLNYTLRVDNNVSYVDLSYIKPNGATVTGDTGTLNLLSKVNVFRVSVTAEDGVTKKVYTITIYKTNDVNEVTDILVDDASLIDSVDSSGFIQNRFNYNLGTVPYSKSSIKLQLSLVDPSTKVWINGNLSSTFTNVNLVEGTNTITIVVKSEYESERNIAGLTYTLVINRTLASSDTSLTGINVNGISVNDFDSLDSEVIYLPSGTKFALIEVFGKHANATVLYDGVTSNNIILNGSALKTVTIKVTAQNGDYKNYYVSIQAANTNNIISNIILSGISLDTFTFDPNIKNYTIEVPFKVTSTIVTVSTPVNAKSVVSGAGNYSLVSSNQYDNTIIVYATSEAGFSGDVYTINIKREGASSNTNITGLQIYKGSSVVIGNELLNPLEFDPEDDIYEVRVDNNISSIFITAQKESSEVITGVGRKALSMGTNIFMLTVTAEDNFTSRVINIKVTRANDNNTISSILVDGESKPTTPKGDIDEIVLNTSSNPFLFSQKTINIAGVLDDPSAKLYIDGTQALSLNHTLKEGQQTIVVYAVSEFGTKSREIHISYYRLSAATSTTLTNLSAETEDGTSLAFDGAVFDPSVEAYVITLGDHDTYTKVRINAIGEDLPYKVITGQTGLQNLNWVNDSLNHKLNIVVTAENGSSRTYSITFLKNSTLNSNTGINSFTVKDSTGKSYISFIDDNIPNKGVINLPFSVSTLIFNIVTTDPRATVSWDNGVLGANTFTPGSSSIIYFRVTAQDGTVGTEYYFEVSRTAASTDQSLNTLSVKDKFGTEYIENFPNTNLSNTFNIRVNNNIDEVIVNGTVLAENKSRIVNGLGTYSLNSGVTTEIKVFVQAEDGSMDKPYIIKILRANTNANISSVEIDGNGVSLSSFIKDQSSGRDIYVLELNNVIFSKDSLNIVINPEDINARVTGGGNVSLKEGINSFTFFITAQDNITKSNEYRIDIFRESSSNNSSLTNLEFVIDGVDVLSDENTFSPTKTLYEISIDRGVLVGTITPTLAHSAAFVSGDVNSVTINQGTLNEYRIIVTAEDKVSVTTYVIKLDVKNTNNKILDISASDINSNSLNLSPVFNQSTYIYTLDNVIYSISKIKLNVTLDDSLYGKYTVKFKNGNIVDANNILLNEGLNTFEIFSTSESGVVGNIYEVSITRLDADTNTHLNNITVRESNEFGEVLPNGNISVVYGKYDYTINLNASHLATSVYISAEAFSSKSNIISGLGIHPLSSEGATPIKITVLSESNETTEYYVTIVKGGISPVSSDGNIYGVKLLHNDIDYINKDISLIPVSMTLELPNFVESVYLDINAHSKAQIIGDGVYNLTPGVSVVIRYSVIAEDGVSTSQEYELTVTRTAREENTLEDLFITVDGKKILIDPVQDVNEVIVGMEVTEVTIGGVLPAGATTSGFKTYPINSNEELIYLTVKSESGIDKIYTVKVIRKNSNTNITSVVIDGVSYLLSDFNNKVLYLPNLSYSKNTINLLVTPEDSKATVIGNGVINLDPEHNAIKFRVEAEDKTLGDEYTIIVYRELISDDATLKDLFVTVGGVKIPFNEVFNPNNLTYSLTISRGVSLYVNAQKNHSNASIGGDFGNITILEINQGGVTEFRIHVTAEDGVTKLIYRINVTAKNNVSLINDITVSNQDSINLPLNQTFDSLLLNYTVNDVEYANKFISIIASFEDSYASLIVKNSKGEVVDPTSISLEVGSNVFTVYALAEDGITTSSEYKITINRQAADTINTLTDLYVTRTNESGEVLDFVEGEYVLSNNSYTIYLPKTDLLSSIYIHASKESSLSTIVGDKLRTLSAADNNLLKVDVISEDNITNSYYINVIRGGSSDSSSDASILGVNLLDQDMFNYLINFNKNVAIQTPITVSYSVSSVFLLVSSYPNATVTGNGSYELTPGVPKTITFQVTSEDGTNTSLQYSITVTRENPIDDNYLDDLYIDVTDSLGNEERITLDATKLLNEVSINKNAVSVNIGTTNQNGHTIKGLGLYTIDGNEKLLKVTVSSPNSDDKEYIIRLHKASSNTDFSSIIINGTQRLQDFNNRVLDLGNIPFSIKTLSVEATAFDQNALVNGEARNYTIEYALTKTGALEYNIFVLAEDGTIGPKYTIRLNRLTASSNANLSSLTVTDNTTSTSLLLNPAFNSNTLKYSIDLTNLSEVKELLITGIKENSNASITGNGVYILKSEQGESSQTFNVVVTAEDGVNVKTYEILVTREITPEDDNTINEISLIGSNSVNYLGLDNNALYKFELSKYEYFISVPYEVKNVTLYISNNNGATPYGLGRHNITSKTTEIEFYMVSKSMVPSNTYKITIIQDDPSDDNLLSNLIIDGKTVTNFSPNVFEYTINVVSEKVSQIAIDAILNDPNALLTGDIGVIELPNGRTQLKINVRAESGVVKTYTVNVDRLSGNNEISDISLNNNAINLGYQPEKLVYRTTVSYQTTSITINAQKAHSMATLEGVGLKTLNVGSNYFTVYATAENGEKGSYYQVEVIRESPSSDSSLKLLEIYEFENGPLVSFNPVFMPSTLTYNIAIDEDATLNSLFIKAQANSPYARGVSGTGFKWLRSDVDGKYHNILEVTVLAEDGVTSTTYTINVYRDVDLSKDVTIGGLELIGSNGINYLGTDNGALKNFNPSIFTYVITVPYNLASTTLNVATSSATIYGAGTKSFGSSSSVTYEIYLVSQDSTVQTGTYTIVVEREEALTSNNLASLLINEQDMLNFSPDKTQYEITLSVQKYTNILITATAEDSSAMVSGDIGGHRLVEGTQSFVIVVTAQSGNNKTYTVIVNYVQSNALLEELQIYTSNNDEYDPDEAALFRGLVFDSETFEYTLKVDKLVKTLNISGAAQDLANALVIGFGTYELEDEGTKINIFVQSADGKQLEKYVLNVLKEDLPSNNSKLKDLKINNGEYKLTFDPNVRTYSVTVKSNVTNLDVEAITDCPYAAVSITGSEQIDEGKNVLMVLVQAEDGSVSFYQVSVIRDSAPDYFLLVMLIVAFLVWVLTIVYFLIFSNRKKGKNRPVVI